MIKSIHILLLFMFFGTHFVYSQNTNDTINKIDDNGLKQGLWVFYGQIIDTADSDIELLNSNQEIHIDTIKTIKSTGHFEDDKKIGTWEYFYQDACTFSTLFIEKYHENGAITTIEKDIEATTFYNKDSSFVSVEINSLKQNISIICTDKKECRVSLRIYDFIKFDYQDLEIEKYKLATGYYQKETNQLDD